MWMRQEFVACLCVLLSSQQITAVVNNVPNSKTTVESTSSSSETTNSESSDNDSGNAPDSISASSEKEANRREAPLSLTDTFATPIALDGIYGPPIDSYLPEVPSNLGLPIPVYGVPNLGSNLIYPAPPPGIPPPLPSVGLTYGAPNANINLPLKGNYGPPKISFGPQKIYGPPKHLLATKYGPPFPQRPPKPFGPPSFNKGPKPFYGPPRFQSNLRPGKDQFNVHKITKLFYGPPKQQYGPPKLGYGPPKQINVPLKPIFRPPADGLLNPPHLVDTYGPPTISIDIINEVGKQQFPINYGPPEPVPHGPPHPGAPAPPTPPDIKYDGWQPIPGLVSRPPSGLYGAPNGQQGHGSLDIQLNADFVPPQVGGGGVHSLGLQDSYKSTSELSDSYGAPLNTVTGSGGIVSTSGEAHGHYQQQQRHQQNQHHGALNIGLSAIGLGGHDNSLSVVKSVGYELFSNNRGLGFGGGAYQGGGHLDTYSSPPANSYSPDGRYAAAHSYITNGLSQSGAFESSFSSSFDSVGKQLALTSNGVGLVPPNGLYGVAPSSQYGTPLFQPNTHDNLNALEINPPKRPVVFREPVPQGFIESIGNAVAQKDAHSIIESSHANLGGPTYIPPPIPDITKPVREPEPPQPSTLYSLPNIHNPISFQNLVQGSSTAGLYSDFSDNFNGFASNLGSADGTFALPLKSNQINFNVDQSQNAVSVDQAQGGDFAVAQAQGNAFNIDQSHAQVYNLDQSHGNAVAQTHGNAFNIDQSHGQVYNLEQSHGNAFSIDQSRGVAFNGYNVDQAHGHVGLDFNSLPGGYSVPNFGTYQNVQHDCSLHKSQPLPQLSYGVPSANTYTESLSSLKTNIGGSFQGQLPQLTYGVPDLQAAHSQSSVRVSSGSSGNIIDDSNSKENYRKSLGESFAVGSELIKSQSLDLNNIPVQGALGSYALQIESADGLVSTDGSSHVPHDQVLKDGLLQSILAAIEQPQQQNVNIHGQPFLPPNESRAYVQIANVPNPIVQEESTSEVEKRSDGETLQSIKNVVAVSPPVTEATAQQNTNETEAAQETDSSLHLADNNEIALYFSNNSENQNAKGEGSESGQQDNVSKTGKLRNAQQYGSYVSFKTPSTSYVYGDLKPSQTEKTSDVKE